MRARLYAAVMGERGVALPTAMIVLVILMGLTFAFTSLATTEPLMARNHTMATQARVFAESGVERAMWAMTSATPAFTSGTAAAPYNGSEVLSVSTNGGFTVRITDTGNSNEKNVVAVGWAPDNSGQFRAARKIQATIMAVRLSTFSPPCALCVMGTVELGGNTTIDSRSNHCAGATPQGGTMTTGATAATGAAKVYGPGNDTYNEPGTPSPDLPSLAATGTFDSFKLTTDEIATLRARAQAAGTYYQGAQTFSDSRLPPSGIVFVDTTTGADYTSTTPDAEAGSVTLNGTVSWNGWLIVQGSITVSGTVTLSGTVYAMNDFTFTGNGTITGAVISENRKDSFATVVDTAISSGTSNIYYDCELARTGGTNPDTGQPWVQQKWSLKLGSFRELDGQS